MPIFVKPLRFMLLVLSSRSLLLSIRKKVFGVKIIIFGKHSQDWMDALGEKAKVWKTITGIRDLKVIDPELTNSLKGSIGIRPVVIIPLIEHHIDQCPKKFLKLIPCETALKTFRYKDSFHKYALEQNLSSYCPTVYNKLESIHYPCVLKRTDLNAGYGIAFVRSSQELEVLLDKPLWKGHPFVIQEFIPGTREYVLHCICQFGKIYWNCSYSYDLNFEGIRTSQTYVQMEKCHFGNHLISKIEKFLLPLKYSGPCNIDFKFTKSGKLKILEINPRLGGSLMKANNFEDLQAALSCLLKLAA